MKLFARLAGVLFVFCFLSLAANAATFTVTNTQDAGAGSLRQVMLDAENNPGADTINVAVAGTVNLTSSLPTVTQSLTINGGGQNGFIVSGQNAVRVFNVSTSGDLQLNNLTVRDGRASGSGGRGGGIRNSGALTITGSTITANSTDQDGGGIANFGTLTINNSTVSNNSAFSGGGIYNVNTLSINNSTLSGNAATTANGGGLLNGGDATINNSTFSGNTCYLGCGIFNETGSLTLGNSTVVYNVNNVGAGLGGGIYNNNGIAAVGNSVAALNTAGNSPDVQGDFVSRGYNLIGRGGGGTGFNAPGDQVGGGINSISPRLTLLQDNGGPTLTHAPLPDSPVIDKGKNLAADASNNPITTDQRGRARTIDLDNNNYPNASGGDGTDIGAVEFQAPPPTAASVTVSGRVSANNRGAANVRVIITGADGQTRTALTNSFGYYRFDDVPAGATYVFQARHKRFEFAPQVLSVSEEVNNLNFTAVR